MIDRVLIRERDLLHLTRTIGFSEIPGIELASLKASDFPNDNEDNIAQGISKDVGRHYTEQMECLLLGLSVMVNSTHRLFIQIPSGLRYAYRNIYLFGEGILIADKEQGSDCIRFSIVPYITLAIGAVSSCADAGEDFDEQEKTLHITEIFPEAKAEYDTPCIPGKEPLEIDRMVRFLALSHQSCLKGARRYE